MQKGTARTFCCFISYQLCTKDDGLTEVFFSPTDDMISSYCDLVTSSLLVRLF